MDEIDLILSPELEAALDEFYNAPQPAPIFTTHLEAELRHRFNEPSRSNLKKQFFMEGFMQMLRTRPILVIIVVVIALLALTGVAYAVGRLTGFIPGYGFTESVQGIYVLDGQVEGKNGNLMVKLEKAIQDDNNLILEVSKTGPDYRIGGASIQPENSEKIYALKMFEVGANRKFVFPKLENPQEPITLMIYAMELAGYPNSETVSISFHLHPILPGDMIIQPTDAVPLVDHHDGLTLSLDSIAYDKDRTVLQVSLKFDHPGNIGGMWSVALTDQNGIPYPLQDITPPDENYYTTTDMNNGSTTTHISAGDATRVYETTALHGNGPFTLALTVMPVNEPFSIYVYDWAKAFKFDPGPNPQVGQTWQMDEKIDVNNIHFHVTSAELHNDNGLKLVFQASTEDSTLYVNLSPDDETISAATTAIFSVPNQDGFSITFPLSRMPEKPIQFMLSMAAYKPKAPFQVTWQPLAEIHQASGLPTITPIPTALYAEIPTFTSSDPLVLEVQSLMQRYDGWLQKGPGWVHLVHEYSKDPEPNAVTVPYARTEEWLEIDDSGRVLRSVQIDRDRDGTVIQQIATKGGHSVNFTYGGTFDSPAIYRVSIDNVTQQVQGMISDGNLFSREVTTCDDGSACLLITFPVAHRVSGLEVRSGWRVWINLVTGQQVRQEEFHMLEDGLFKVDYTFRYLLIEKVADAPQQILDILKNVDTP